MIRKELIIRMLVGDIRILKDTNLWYNYYTEIIRVGALWLIEKI